MLETRLQAGGIEFSIRIGVARTITGFSPRIKEAVGINTEQFTWFKCAMYFNTCHREGVSICCKKINSDSSEFKCPFVQIVIGLVNGSLGSIDQIQSVGRSVCFIVHLVYKSARRQI